MAQANPYQPSTGQPNTGQPNIGQKSASPIFRLDQPSRLDLDAIEANAAKPQRGAWRYLASIFDSARKRYCTQFSIEPDATLWRLRYHMIEGFEEHIISDPSVVIWALEALQIQLWGDEYHKKPNRTERFSWLKDGSELLIELRVVKTVNGDVLQFDVEPMASMPPLLDEIGLVSAQLHALRDRLQHHHGMVLITSSNQRLLDDTLLAINQELIAPDRKLLSISERHRYSLPRTMQIDLHACSHRDRQQTWQNALDTFHDVLLSTAQVPEQFQEQIADRCDQGTLGIQTMRVSRAADAINLLNAGILRRAPMHRAINTVVNHFPVAGICPHCAVQARLSDDEQQWLEQLRTPATENVISWLADGNAEQFMHGEGCAACAETGYAQPLSVFKLLHRDEKTNQFPTPASSNPGAKSNQANADGTGTLQRQLMGLAKSGKTTISEVIRVLESE